jgi:hypothetical protein
VAPRLQPICRTTKLKPNQLNFYDKERFRVKEENAFNHKSRPWRDIKNTKIEKSSNSSRFNIIMRILRIFAARNSIKIFQPQKVAEDTKLIFGLGVLGVLVVKCPVYGITIIGDLCGKMNHGEKHLQH